MTHDLHTPSRRRWLQAATALGAGAALAACAPRPGRTHPETTTMDLLHTLFDDLLAEAPQEATALGLDTGARAGLRRRWADRSPGNARRQGERYATALAQLDAPPGIDIGTDHDTDATATLAAARFALGLGVEGTGFPYGDQGLMATLAQEGTPYVINQMIGLALSAPQFLATQHPLRTADDQQAWLDRLAALPRHIDGETERFRHDAGLAVRPPRFVLATLLDQLDTLLATPPAQAPLLAALADHPALAPQALALLARGLYPAVQRQRDAVQAAMAHATDDAGVRHLPEGERYYAWALRVGTTTTLSADEVHRIGLDQAAEIDARMDTLLRAQGLTQGTVGQRMAALGQDARHRFADSAAGREAAITYCNEWVVRLRAALPQWSALALQAAVDVKRVPVETEAGAAGAYMAPGALDGSRPAAFYLNLRDTAAWPRWSLPTLVVHETLPGHVWQEAYEAERARRHPIRALLKFNGYSEGWALYAEQLVDEAGFYDDDPLARLGYLQAQQLRATRLVVDTGLHAFGWSRERAIQALTHATGRPHGAVQGEVDRYCVKPGQACGYKVGQNELMRLRAAHHGAPQAFNDAVLRAGNLPLPVLAQALGAG